MRSLDFSGYALKSCVAAALLAGCGGSHSQPPIGSTTATAGAPSYSYHKTFYYTGKKQTFKVPTGVTRIAVVARGGAGGGIVYYNGNRSGRGGRVHAVIP